jgi:hypothetical protein
MDAETTIVAFRSTRRRPLTGRSVFVAVLLSVVGLSPAACTDGASSAPAPAPRPNYHEDVRPLLAAHCLDCHYPTDTVTQMVKLAPYENARQAAPLIRHALVDQKMPLWGMDNSSRCETWKNARWLDPKDVETLIRWVDLGAPEGDPARAGPPPSAHHVPQALRHADVTLDPGADYVPDLGAGVVRCFIVDPMLTSRRLLTALEVLPAKPWSVEQVTLYELETPEAEAAASALDSADLAPGYACLTDAMVKDAKLVAGSSWIDATPSSWVTRLPDGLGVALSPGRKMVLQVHYNLIAGMNPDRSKVRLELDDAVGEACWLPLELEWFSLEPSTRLTSAHGFVRVPRDVQAHAAYPRMRFLGKGMSITAESACLAEMSHWDQHGLQHLYVYEQPPALRAGESVHMTCNYTTLGHAQPVMKGSTPDDEECSLQLLVTPCP